ncbi:sel1 repeat family protein [Devosia sp. MC521]|uniref:sel1 repeat family protein n=1 Tax=Devosia sp. MC521 TaxID=2759954 RepID=UPI0015FA2F74|nr:sel1 repeat family protein [Devosia sp. MC521]MBJ6987270.1 sel1 repeat family protein [Devosia sp. MC521]QMW62878.1 sel1 repeat family protein [Devosia sp. MC521]
MALFQNPFFKSNSNDTEAEYTKGVVSLQSSRFEEASQHFQIAASGGHVSALYNLSIIHGSGLISPWSFDAAADCWYKGASLGHPSAQSSLWMLEAADRGGFGYDNLAKMSSEQSNRGQVNAALMTCAARFTDVLCKKYGASNDFIAYEIDAARQSDDEHVRRFVERTGLSNDVTTGGLDRLIPGSAADQITDGLNQFSVAQLRSGMDEKYVTMSRCTVVGYVIQKSVYGSMSKPLLGVADFLR